MDEQQDTPGVLGKFLGLTIPGKAQVYMHAHSCTVGECEAILHQALDTGLPVAWKELGGTRWCDIRGHQQELSLFLPTDFPSEWQFNETRRKPTEPFEIAAPAGVSA